MSESARLASRERTAGGHLSEASLADFTRFFLMTCLEQVRFMRKVMRLEGTKLCLNVILRLDTNVSDIRTGIRHVSHGVRSNYLDR